MNYNEFIIDLLNKKWMNSDECGRMWYDIERPNEINILDDINIVRRIMYF